MDVLEHPVGGPTRLGELNRCGHGNCNEIVINMDVYSDCGRLVFGDSHYIQVI